MGSGKKPRWRRLPPGVRREVLRARAQGLSYSQIVAELGLSLAVVGRVLAPLGGGDPPGDADGRHGLAVKLEERVEIRIGLERRCSYRQIGQVLGRAASTICREVAAGGGRDGYRPVAAHKRAWQDAHAAEAARWLIRCARR